MSTTPTNFELTPEFEKLFDALEHSRGHYFITGKAGTGKSTFLQYFKQRTRKRIAVLSPTGLSALNVGGQTIHSFFNFKPGMIEPANIGASWKRKLFRNLDAIVIDEVSMVRCDLFDGIDTFLRINGPVPDEPFGGIQMILFGDLYQLPPVVRQDEMPILATRYDSPYFFSANAAKNNPFDCFELTTIFRQHDDTFIDILNAIRHGNIDRDQLDTLNTCVKPAPDETNPDETAVHLVPTNAQAERINQRRLAALTGDTTEYPSKSKGQFNAKDNNLPAPAELTLKPGAKVMLTKNHPQGEWVNGNLGTIVDLGSDQIAVELTRNGKIVVVTRDTWERLSYSYDESNDRIDPEVVGKYTQFPLRLAWAITIHKSQGQTVDKAHINLSTGAFAHGQTYVALSRCTTLEGLTLTRPLQPRDIIVDDAISDFMRAM